MIRYTFGLIFLALLGQSWAFWGKSSKQSQKQKVEVLEVPDEIDWTDAFLPVFNFGFGDAFHNFNHRHRCGCQLTTPSPREICPTNVTMNVTSGQHSWWKGGEMRRVKTRSRRHSHGRHAKSYKKSKLKSGCPVNVQLPPCPEKISVRKGRHAPYRKSGKYNKKMKGSSSEEDDFGWFAAAKNNKKVNRKEVKLVKQTRRCVDPKSKKTQTYFPEATVTSTVYATVYNNRDRENEEDDEEDEEEFDDSTASPTFRINVSPIETPSTSSIIQISASKTQSSQSESTYWSAPAVNAPLESSITTFLTSQSIWMAPASSSVSTQATGGLNDLLGGGGGDRRYSSVVMNEKSLITSSAAFSFSSRVAIQPSSTLKSEIAATTVTAEMQTRSMIDPISSGSSLDSILNREGVKNRNNSPADSNSQKIPEVVSDEKRNSVPENSAAPAKTTSTPPVKVTEAERKVETQSSGGDENKNAKTSASTQTINGAWRNTNAAPEVATPINNLRDLIEKRTAPPITAAAPVATSPAPSNGGGLLGLLNKNNENKIPAPEININPPPPTFPTAVKIETMTTSTANTQAPSTEAVISSTLKTTTFPPTTTTAREEITTIDDRRSRWKLTSKDSASNLLDLVGKSEETADTKKEEVKITSQEFTTKSLEVTTTKQLTVKGEEKKPTAAELVQTTSTKKSMEPEALKTSYTKAAETTFPVENTPKNSLMDILSPKSPAKDEKNTPDNLNQRFTTKNSVFELATKQISNNNDDQKTTSLEQIMTSKPVNPDVFKDTKNSLTTKISLSDLLAQKSTLLVADEKTTINNQGLMTKPWTADNFKESTRYTDTTRGTFQTELTTKISLLDILAPKSTLIVEEEKTKNTNQGLVTKPGTGDNFKEIFTETTRNSFKTEITTKISLLDILAPKSTLGDENVKTTLMNNLNQGLTTKNSLLESNSVEPQTTTKKSNFERVKESSRYKDYTKAAETTLSPEPTTKISLLDILPPKEATSRDEPVKSTDSNLNPAYGTTKNSLSETSTSSELKTTKNSGPQLETLSGNPSTEKSGPISTRNSRGKISEVVTENYSSSGANSGVTNLLLPGSKNDGSSSGGGSFNSSPIPNQAQTSSQGAPNLLDLIKNDKVSGTRSVPSVVENKRGEDKIREPSLNDLLRGGKSGGGGDNPNEKEITFSTSDKSGSVTGADTKYNQQPPRSGPTAANNNFHEPPPPAKNPVNNWEARNNENRRDSEKKAGENQTEGHDHEDDHQRKYVFYLLFGNPNCNVCSGTAASNNNNNTAPMAMPKISVSQDFPQNSGGIKWSGGDNSFPDGEGGSFYIGYRKGGGGRGSAEAVKEAVKTAGETEKEIRPVVEIKMSQAEKSCNSVFRSFFA